MQIGNFRVGDVDGTHFSVTHATRQGLRSLTGWNQGFLHGPKGHSYTVVHNRGVVEKTRAEVEGLAAERLNPSL